MTRFPRPLPALLLLVFAACGESAAGSSTALVRDSAGIRIVENAAPQWKDGQGWRLSAEPTLQVGQAEGAPEYLLSDVRAALRRSDGTLLVANAGSKEIRYYDASGRYLRTAGRPGRGPGEFQAIGLIHDLAGDTLFAFDPMLLRISLFTPQGEFIRSVQLERTPDGGFPALNGVLGDGSLVIRTFASAGDARGEAHDGLRRTPERFLHYSPAGQLLDTIATQPGSERYVQTQSEGSTLTMVSIMTPLFGRSQVQAVSGDRVVLGGNDAYELGVYTPRGDLERLVRRRQEPRPVTDESVAVVREARLAAVTNPQRRRQMERAFADMPRPATMPFYEDALVDDAGYLWVRDFQPDPDAPPVWTVFDAEGRMLGPVSMPRGFRPMQVTEDFVVGVARDDLDVEHVLVYGLEKS